MPALRKDSTNRLHELLIRGDRVSISKYEKSQMNGSYLPQVPAFAKVKTHHSLEVNGFVFVWHHAEEIEPTWEPFQIPELEPSFGSDQWIYRGRTEYEVNAHIEDLPENGADAQHLQAWKSPKREIQE